MTANARSLRQLFRQRYIAGLLVLVAVACASLYIFFDQNAQESSRAELIHQTSAQKALSQRIAFFVNAIAGADTSGERLVFQSELRSTIAEMRRTHAVLSGAQPSPLIAPQHLKSIRDIYANDYAPLEYDILLFLSTAEKFVELESGYDQDSLVSEINLLGVHTIMQAHDVIAKIIHYEAAQADKQSQQIQAALMMLFVLLLIAESVIIFEPMGKKIEQSVRDAELAEKQAQQEADRARTADEAKSNFLRLMSHELRTPLNAVIGMSKLLQNTKLDASQAEFTRHIHDAGRHMLSVADDIMTLNQHNIGKMTLNPKPIDLGEELKSVITMAKAGADQKDVDLKLENALSFSNAKVDINRLRQILYNLVSNAVKFTERGHVTLAVNSFADSTNPDLHHLEIRVADTGCGIAVEERDRIFDEFGQAHNLGARSHNGLGLGLPISRRLAELMDGTLILEASSPFGSTFLLKLPVMLAPAPRKEAAKTSKEAVSPPGKILVVDDNLPNRMIAAAYLKKSGYTVEFAENGREAVEAVDEHDDLMAILMDIEMPIMDGITATKVLRSKKTQTAQMPIIALTAHALPEDRDNLMAEGFNEVLRKPSSETEIVSCIQRFTTANYAA